MDILEKMTGNISENTACWNAVESSIESHGVDVPEGTPKSDYAEKVDAVYEAGKKAEYDAFWDNYQQNGERTLYECAFAGKGWNERTFKPKYDIRPTSAYGLFWHLASGTNIDLVSVSEECGINFDFSQCTLFQYAFYSSGLTRIGVIDTRSCSSFQQFAASNGTLHTIEKLILKEDGSQTFSNASWFLPVKLKNITIEGKFGDTINFGACTQLTKQSIINIINALSDTATGKSLTLLKSLIAHTDRFGSVDSEEWQSLVASKPNWTISLI